MLGVLVWSGSCILAYRLRKIAGIRHPDAVKEDVKSKKKDLAGGKGMEKKKKRRFTLDVTLHIGPVTD
ncbi:hypothetical protein BSKO_03117 [Bryopsis sp. KO-2023]|nr:hypothetical protein BSKO_03117 [Bryopsis sp. KO-2023]